MLKYQMMGPGEDGLYSVMYPIPGKDGLFFVAGKCRTVEQAESEVARLNEEPISELRQKLRDRANRVVRDLPKDDEDKDDGEPAA